MLPVLAATVYPALVIVLIVAVFEFIEAGRDDDEPAYDVADYAAPPAIPTTPARRTYRPAVDDQTAAWPVADILPPAPRGTVAGAGIWAQLQADRILRELAAEARMEMTR